MAASRRARHVALTSLLAHAGVADAVGVIASGRVLVDGAVITNPAARVRSDCAIRILPDLRLKGDLKLSYALDELEVPVAGRVALDLGASAGGFTSALLSRGVRRVYAVDAGVGQLLGSLRRDPRVVNLEGHNLGSLDLRHVADVVELVTVDLSYLALADALPQLNRVQLHPRAHLVALVKPTFELHRGEAASSEVEVDEAVSIASRAMRLAGWAVLGQCAAPTTGKKRSKEVFLLGRKVG
jgi:23S rRNA (cytidine1920-2'-O)/16S rRNA (cytidine1409-2'-O)-methyltransferase